MGISGWAPGWLVRMLDWLAKKQRAWFTWVAFALAAATPLTAALVNGTKGTRGFGWAIAAQVFVAVGVWAVPMLQKRRSETEQIQQKRRTYTALGDAVDPVLVQLNSMVVETDERQRSVMAHEVHQLAMTAATVVCGPERARATYFALTQDGNGKRRLEKSGVSVGRVGQATASFTEGTANGDLVFSLLDQDREHFVDDVDDESKAPPEWSSEDRGDYKTFIAVPVLNDGVLIGMLSLDSVDAGDLRQSDVNILRVISRVVATAQAYCI